MKTIGEILEAEWADPASIDFENEAAEDAFVNRRRRFIDAVKLKEPDRVPVHQGVGFFSLKHADTTLKAAMYDYNEANEAWLQDLAENEWDVAYIPYTLSGSVMEALGVNHIKWPGHGVADDSRQYQFIEPGQKFDGEVQYEPLQPEDYDYLISNPSDYILRKHLPNKWEKVKPLTDTFPLGIASFHLGEAMYFSTPGLSDAFEAMAKAARESERWSEKLMDLYVEMERRGFPVMSFGVTYAPFDFIGDFMRGTEGILSDIYEYSDEVKEACESVLPMMEQIGLAGAHGSGNPIVAIYLHKGIFLRPDQFQEFYWPTLRDLILGLLENGAVTFIYSEGDYTPYLEIIKEGLPPESSIWHIEQDIFEAKEILGDTLPLSGGLKATPLARWNPEEVRDYYEENTSTLAEGGGFIFAEDVPMYESDPENLKVALETIRSEGTAK